MDMVRYLSLLLFIGLAFTQDITIAVLDFDGDGVSQSETRTLTNRLRDEMFQTGVYIVLERGKMDEVLKEQGFQQTGCITSECAVEVGRMLGVKKMVAGSIGKVGTVYTVSARIFDVETGKILKSANYDHVGDIGQLLIKGMRDLAYDLTGKGLQNDAEVATKKTELNVDEKLSQYMKCWKEKDYICMSTMVFPKVIEEAGGVEGFVEMMNSLPSLLEELGMEMDASKMIFGNRKPIVKHDNYIITVVPTTLPIILSGLSGITEGSIIGFSEDNGDTWFFIEGTDEGRMTIANYSPEILQKIDVPTPMLKIGEKTLIQKNGQWIPQQ